VDMFKDACTNELRRMTEEWNKLSTNPNATERDFTRLRAKILEVCEQLDAIEMNEKKSAGKK
jgi:hypothetical protein